MPTRELRTSRDTSKPRRQRLLGVFAAAVVGSIAASGPASFRTTTVPRAMTDSPTARAPAARADLASEVRAAVLASKLNPGAIGYTILDCHGETVLAASNATLPLIPASNLKALTTAAAIDMLGERFAFETRLVLTRNGDRTTLTLFGSGDPALFDPEVLGWSGPRGNWTTVDAAIDAWSGALLAAGVRRVDEFVVDGRIFDNEPIPTGDRKWIANRDAGTYAVGVWGLNIGANAATLRIAGRDGAKPSVASAEPPFPFTLTRNTATVNRRAKETFSITYGDGAGGVEIKGNLRRTSAEYAVGVHQPMPLAAEMIAKGLSSRGIAVTAWTVASASDPAATGVTVQPVLSTPIEAVLYGANTHSKNIYAEALVKRLGAHWTNPGDRPIGPQYRSGSWSSGHDAILEWLTKRLSTECKGGLCLADGSGLSDRNQVTADLMARMLASMASDPRHARTYLASFARPSGEGTLEKRFKDAELHGMSVFAKSGYINDVSCLSGVIVSRSGEAVAWSVLCNDLGGKVREAKALQEKIVESIARTLADRAPATTAAAQP